MTEIISKLGNNIKSISYDTEDKIWTVNFKNRLTPSKVPDTLIIDFVENA